MPAPRLEQAELIKTATRLGQRIRSRFPAAHLNEVASQLQALTEQHAERSNRIRRPNWGLRLVSATLLLAGLATLLLLFESVRFRHDGDWQIGEAMQALEAGVSMLFFLGAGAVLASSLELRTKRRRCLEALHELRAIAHLVDLHQLTKLPIDGDGDSPDPTVDPAEATLTTPRLILYLDFCSEMLALIGKVAALYVQEFPDEKATGAVDDIEDLTTGLSRKIWQKIMVLAGPRSSR